MGGAVSAIAHKFSVPGFTISFDMGLTNEIFNFHPKEVAIRALTSVHGKLTSQSHQVFLSLMREYYNIRQIQIQTHFPRTVLH